jgi:DNA-binding transcriptional ArsR family regulator
MTKIYEPDQILMELILEEIKDGGKSISALSRDLKEKGLDMHKLVLTGYLKALADLGMVREREIPPSKVYTSSSTRKKSIYEHIGENARDLGRSEMERASIATYAMQKLFKRPVFLDEIRKCNIDAAPEAKGIGGDERSDAKKIITKAGYKLPFNDPAYMVQGSMDAELVSILQEIVIQEMRISTLVAKTKQLTL